MEKIRLKFVCQLVMGQSPNSESVNSNEEGIPFLQGKTDFGLVSPSPTTWCSEPKKIATKNSILLSVRAPVGSINLCDQDYAIGRGLCAIIHYKLLNGFCWYVLQTIDDELLSRSTGTTYDAVSVSDVANIFIVVPPLAKQAAIAAYLDHHTAKIDSLLADLQSQANQLERYKRELIADAVTHGIDRTVPRKKSGVDWIGKIPKHWNTMRIKYLFKLRKDRNYLPEDEVELLSLYTDLGVIRHQDLTKTTGNKSTTVEEYKNVSKNDIIVNIILCWMGAIGRSDYDGVTSPAYDVYSPNTSLAFSHYYHYLFRTPKFNGECYKRGRGIMLMRWRTYSDDFGDIRVPQPPIEEQEKIAAYLKQKTAQVDSLISDINKQIEKLKQYRQIVIHDAVTGKIKVKEIQGNGN